MFGDDPDTAGEEGHGQRTTKKAEPPDNKTRTDIDGHEETPSIEEAGTQDTLGRNADNCVELSDPNVQTQEDHSQ